MSSVAAAEKEPRSATSRRTLSRLRSSTRNSGQSSRALSLIELGRAQSRSAGWLIAVWSETFPHGPERSLRARREVELAQDVADVSTRRALADHQLCRDLLVRLAGSHHPQDLSLPIGEL